MSKPALAVHGYGQSVWLDEIQRKLLTSGEFERLVHEEGVTGVTANPSIFQKAISGGNDYDAAIATLAAKGLSPSKIAEQLAVQDLRQAATILRPCYNRTGGEDGFVSIEVAPEIADDTEATVAEVRRLWGAMDHPNVLIKIPGTRAGLPAIEAMLAEGININITLLFSVHRYRQVMEAYLSALERRVAEGKPIDQIHSVASFFVSRVDTLVDRKLDERARAVPAEERERLQELRSRVAIANAKVAYERFRETFDGPRWESLRLQGASPQRPLWASTSAKDPRLPDTYYADALIGPHTINTMPLATLLAFNDHGIVAPTLEAGFVEAHETLDWLAEAGIDLNAVTDQLEREGVKAFADSAAALRKHIETKAAISSNGKRIAAAAGGRGRATTQA